MTEAMPNCRGAELIRVIRVETAEGEGKAGDPVRLVVRYFSPEGQLLATHDSWAEDQKMPEPII